MPVDAWSIREMQFRRYRSVGNLVFSNQQAVTKRTRERIHKIADNRSIERRIEREIEIIKDKETLTSGESKRKEQRLRDGWIPVQILVVLL